MTGSTDTSDREIVTERVFDAPPELVFETWTHPAHLDRWWGPRAFVTKTHAMDFRVGGRWTYTMTGMGRDWPNEIEYLEITRPERLVYDHGEGGPPHFRVTVTFTPEGRGTRLRMRSVFPTKEALDAVRQFGVEKGAQETMDRLGERLRELM